MDVMGTWCASPNPQLSLSWRPFLPPGVLAVVDALRAPPVRSATTSPFRHASSFADAYRAVTGSGTLPDAIAGAMARFTAAAKTAKTDAPEPPGKESS
jgi:hypothetical protein